MHILLMVLTVLLLITDANAADIYMSTTGTKTSGVSTVGDWSNSNCYGNLQAAMAAMSSGDTLSIDDGTYSGSENTISGSSHPPSGPGIGSGDARFSVIRARNIPGTGGYPINSGLKVYLPTGLYALAGGTPAAYIKFWGIRFSNVNTYTGWDHLYFKQCAFVGINNVTNAIAAGFGGYPTLVEDSVFYGQGRYKLNFANYTEDNPTTNNLCRRCVGRNDFANKDYVGVQDTDPLGTFVSYGNVGDAFLNCIDVDSDSPEFWSNISTELAGAFYAPKPIGGNMLVQGSIVLNSAMGVGSSSGSNGIVYRDVAGIKVAGGMHHKGGSTVERLTLVNASTSNWSTYSGIQLASTIPAYAGVGGYEETSVVTNSIMRGLANPTAFYGNSSADYVNTYSISTMGDTPTHHITTDPLSNGLLYPVRIESGSALETAGSGGGQVGARIVNRLGVDGTFKGEADWNTEQGSLWPWPLETWIKAEMSSMPDPLDGKDMPSPTRGFCSEGQTLTKYIWESLGNTIPGSIYGKRYRYIVNHGD